MNACHAQRDFHDSARGGISARGDGGYLAAWAVIEQQQKSAPRQDGGCRALTLSLRTESITEAVQVHAHTVA
ncbi:hypothetical protein [Roseateles sp. LYH14W]|uniref:Uncharacterized protein n=1 Tax=Pelomonas parva TaxID=3299032 RepID=A0ABW7EZ50_9BURK